MKESQNNQEVESDKLSTQPNLDNEKSIGHNNSNFLNDNCTLTPVNSNTIDFILQEPEIKELDFSNNDANIVRIKC